MSEQIIAKLDEIEANTVAKIEEGKVETIKKEYELEHAAKLAKEE